MQSVCIRKSLLLSDLIHCKIEVKSMDGEGMGNQQGFVWMECLLVLVLLGFLSHISLMFYQQYELALMSWIPRS